MTDMELWDLYDVRRCPLGKTHVRGEPLPKGCYHLSAFVWVFSGDGRVLLTKRSPEKKSYPNLWCHTGGAVLAGEESLHAIARELLEETGIPAEPSEFRLIDSFVGFSSGMICDLYFLTKNVPLSELTMQEGETCDAKWVTRAEFEALIAQKQVGSPDVLRYRQLNGKLDKFFW